MLAQMEETFTGGLKMACLTDYDCIFQIVIRQKSVNGLDLDEHRMIDICKDISELLSEKYPEHGVFIGGFRRVKK